MNIFERACRAKLRFSSVVGELTTEQLFDLPLTAKNKPNLDHVARLIHSELKTFDEVSFVDTKPNDEQVKLQLKMEIVKHIIESKKHDAEIAVTRAQTLEYKRKLLAIKSEKQEESLKSLTMEEIDKKLSELSGSE